MTIDGTEITFTTETETDENWNSIYTYKANGEVLNGTGTKADPFEVGVVLPESADLVKLDMTYKTTADGHYVVVDGLSAKINLTMMLCAGSHQEVEELHGTRSWQ